MRTGTALTAIALYSLITLCCQSIKDKETGNFAEGTKEGYKLAKQYCSACHGFVAADVLDRLTWKDHVLPDMASQLGIGVLWGKEYLDKGDSNASIAFKDWLKIVDYYTKTAPEKINLPKPEVPDIDSSLFSPRLPNINFSTPARSVLVAADTVGSYFYIGDGYTNRIYRWNKHLQLTDSATTGTPPSYAYFFNQDGKRKAIFTTLGIMQAVDVNKGSILEFDLSKKLLATDTLASGMPRPVQSIPGDFNKDGLTDWLVCGFGTKRGELLWLKNLGGNKYSAETIIGIPGATQALVEDFNQDGWDDIMVLFAHSEESLRLFTNNQQGGFRQETLLSFLPVQGSTSFQLIDFNNDGLRDILYTCGDNADISQILKPFHGVYVYLNKGNNKYEQSYFYHINGCTKAVAKDFDQDGDLDIATINFYADHEANPAETFIFLKQVEPMKFQPLSPKINQYGRWLTMDVADYDNDGDADIILGNFSRDFLVDKSFVPEWDQHRPFIILQNKLK